DFIFHISTTQRKVAYCIVQVISRTLCSAFERSAITQASDLAFFGPHHVGLDGRYRDVGMSKPELHSIQRYTSAKGMHIEIVPEALWPRPFKTT
uniref:hypothetical protein n=1 Tax=Escherichia coli TaxID=562 RepID=UPI001A7EA07F